MQRIEFYRVSGSGNDFLALPEPAADPSPDQVRAWCRRGVSLGADGLFTLRRGAPGTVVMDYRNADGTSAGLCLNGTRCAARLAFHLGWATDRVTVETGAGPLPARLLDPTTVAVAAPAPTTPEPVTLQADGTAYTAHHLTIGVPHLVLPWPDLATAPVATLGRTLRHHPALAPQGANVNFIHLTPDHLQIRTYERGVEAETLACGTGVLAAAATLLATTPATLPLTAHTHGGFLLTVTGTDPTSWHLAGDARLLAHGHLFPDAQTTPTPPSWAGNPPPSPPAGERPG